METFNVNHWARDWFEQMGLEADTISYLTLGIDILIVLLISLLADYIARRIILSVVRRYVQRSRNTYDDILLEKRVFQALAHIVPAAIIWYSLPWLFEGVDFSISWLRVMLTIYMIIMVATVAIRLLQAVEYIGLRSKKFEGKPIASYIQVFKIVAYLVAGVMIISMVVGKSPLTILTAFGAATAVILLIFKDTILGLVASIQISANDMVRLGDWVTMDKYGADGDVVEINLTTVKVRNFDMTITTVPTYAFIADSFKNWRGMQAKGVRRIKRSIHIDQTSIRFVNDDMREQFHRYTRIQKYLRQREEEIADFNAANKVDTSELINGRHMTNIGVFREYARAYLESHPKVSKDNAIMVRQLQPTEDGLPLEVYCFCTDIVWANYEGIQADIFDHLLAALPKFQLRIFQNPSGHDFSRLSARKD